MPRTGLFSGYPASFDITSTPSPVIMHLQQMRSISVQPGSRIGKKRVLGSVDTQAAGLASADSRIRIETGDMSTIFSNMSFSGVKVENQGIIRYIERDDGGTFRVGEHHPWLDTKQGFIYLDSVSADQNQEDGAMATLQYIPFWNGSDPLINVLVLQDEATSPPVAFNSFYWLGPAYWADAQWLDGIVGWDFESGINYGTKRENGEPYPRRGAIKSRDWVVRLRTERIDSGFVSDVVGVPTLDVTPKIASIFLSPLDSTALDLYLVRGINCSDRAAAGSSVHIRFSFEIACASWDDLSVSSQDDATLTYQFTVIGEPTVALAVTLP